MAWYRQGSQAGGEADPSMNGDQRPSLRVHDHSAKVEQLSPKVHSGWERSRSGKSKRFVRPGASRNRQLSIGVFTCLLLVVVVCTFFGADYFFSVFRILQGEEQSPGLPFAHEEDKIELFDSKVDGSFAIRREVFVADGHTEQSNRNDLKTENGDRGQGKSKRKRRKSGSCQIPFRNTASGLQVPTDTLIFETFPLNYIQKEKKPASFSAWRPKFAGHQTLMQREESYLARNQTVHCGFVEGPEGQPETGFGLSEDDKEFLQTCHIAVSSCIFGNYDRLHDPQGKNVSSTAKAKVCFTMFVDQETLDGMIEEGEVTHGNMTHGLWRIVLVKTLPYSDNRRTGKVPKLLTHRLFPNAKFSIWLDSKLRLQSDPLLILDHFLWRGEHEYAISNHYDRHCVWDEVAQNKKLNKFDHRVIDEQFEFYQKDGLTRFNASDPHKLLPSYVPEGSFIVRAHTPMSNLFSCLWFNEVERFTSRDQLSFAYTYLKFVRMNPSRHFRFHMFKDCERREMTKLYHHKQEETRKH